MPCSRGIWRHWTRCRSTYCKVHRETMNAWMDTYDDALQRGI